MHSNGAQQHRDTWGNGVCELKRRYAVMFFAGLSLAVILSSSVFAETKSQTILGQSLFGNTSFGATDFAGAYSNGLSWRTTGSPPSFDYVSVGSRGHNSEFGWHLVSADFKYCTNCQVTQQTKAYRCGANPSNCVAANYVVSRHYFESGLIGGSTTFYTSHNGSRSSSACYYTSGC